MELGAPAFWDRLSRDPATLAAEVASIDLNRLDEALQTQAALRAWVGAAHEAARIAEERARWEVTKARAVATLEAKGPDSTGKPKVVAVINAEVDLDRRVTMAQDELWQVQERRGALRAMTDALEDRRDMLVQIAAQRRQEQKAYE